MACPFKETKDIVEGFWGSNAYTPVKNRLYPAYPFGWHSKIEKSDFPRCFADPYNNSNWLKMQVAKNDKVKPMRLDSNAASAEHFIDIRLGNKAHREIMRTLLIVGLVCFMILAIFHLYT